LALQLFGRFADPDDEAGATWLLPFAIMLSANEGRIEILDIVFVG